MENGTYHYKIEAAVPLGIRRGSMAVELHNGALSEPSICWSGAVPLWMDAIRMARFLFRAYWSR